MLTRSIENIVTGDSFPTEILQLTKSDLKSLTKTNGWLFDWRKELNANDTQVYKLTIQNNPNVIQALVSLKIEDDPI